MTSNEQDQCTNNNNTFIDDVNDISNVKIRNQTGMLMFKFDDDEPHECMPIYDYGTVKIEIQQHEKSDKNNATTTSLEFTSNEGKRFKLFIENC